MSSVYFFIPNIIGYLRIIAAAAAFYYGMYSMYIPYFLLYSISQLLDAVDGHAARFFNQATKYGAVLDMITDRASTACLWTLLASQYPEYSIWFMFLVALDICSHFAHMNYSLSSGLSSHKDVSKSKNIFLRLYYGNKTVLFLLCLGNEATFLLMTLFKMIEKENPSDLIVPIEYIRYLLYIAFPLMVIKQWMNIMQLLHSMSGIASIDQRERSAKKN